MLLWCVCLLLHLHACAFDHTALEPLLKQYTRPITVLEIHTSGAACISPYIAATYPGTSVAMVLHDPETLLTKIHDKDLHNLVVTNPAEISVHLLETLSRCEHFDVAIVHEVLKIGKKSAKINIPLLLNLADHVYLTLTQASSAHLKSITCPYEVIEHNGNMSVYLLHPGKDSIKQPRWNKRTTSQKYTIKSSFQHKQLHKNDDPKGTPWTSGINLITFVMLNGLYPTDTIIREHLTAFYEIQHNDLVIGNMVVQGSHIAPIDAHDQRRYLDQRLCLKAALALFSWGRRFKAPEDELLKYSEYIQSRTKRRKH